MNDSMSPDHHEIPRGRAIFGSCVGYSALSAFGFHRTCFQMTVELSTPFCKRRAAQAQDDTPMEEEFDEIEKLQHQGINAGDIKVRCFD